MTSLRKFAFAALLGTTTLNFAPSLASAQEPARGRFTLKHDVRWENIRVPAGEYEFSYNPDSVAPALNLRKINGEHTRLILLVPATERSKASESNRLMLETTADGRYVKAMQLPEFGVTLDFNVPRSTGRQIAKVGNSGVSGQ